MWKTISLGLMAAFLVLYAASLALPGMIMYSVADSRLVTTEGEIVNELNQGAFCRRLGVGRLRLTPDHTVVIENGTRLSSLPSGDVGCTSQDVRLGWQVLVEGWLGPLIGVFAWYANLFALMSIVLMAIGRFPNTSLAFALGGVLLSLDSFRFTGEPSMGMTPGPFLDRFGTGFYAWQISLLVLLLSQSASALSERREAVPAPAQTAQ